MPTLAQTWALPAALLAIVNLSATWYNVVSAEVLEPYLDEFFHVPQAQKYCEGDYTWDPKITTPPGLYLVAKLFEPLIGCDTASLRALNVGALCLICPLCYGILRQLRQRAIGRINPTGKQAPADALLESDPSLMTDAHSALNISLFPPLFFFSALFYTDVISTLVVLLSYSAYLKKSTPAGSIFDNLNAIFVGILALLFRQTNIFWVAVLPAGLTVIEALERNAKPSESSNALTPSDILGRSWTLGHVHDRTVDIAGLQDYVLLILSVGIAAVKKPLLIIRVTLPYVILLALFTGFVIWNGSVVLGDKSAHTATLHLPQMLYIWPYIAFFSAPLLIGPIIQPVFALVPSNVRNVVNGWIPPPPASSITGLIPVGIFLTFGAIAVHLNTIIHPYTLADNRHYVFYVFSILRRYPVLRYLAVPVYCFSAWLTLQALAISSNEEHKGNRKSGAQDQSTSVTARCSPCSKSSFILIWLATTALSVVSAPLVEPRYFIIPWILWRLNVPLHSASLLHDKKKTPQERDIRTVLETIWLIVINGAVTYVFIRWTYEWPNEPGKLQRFLW